MEKTLETRAITSYRKKAALDLMLPRLFTAGTAYRVEIEGKAYVLISNAVGLVGMYSIRTNGSLRWLKRWPAFDQSDIARQIVHATHVAPFATKSAALATLKRAEKR